MQTTKKLEKWLGCAALCGAIWGTTAVADPMTDMTKKDRSVEPPPLSSTRHWPKRQYGAMSPGSDERADMVNVNATALSNTLAEEKTEIANLAAQAAEFRRMGGSQNLRIAALLERMRREHVEAGPGMERLAKRFGAIPALAKPIKPPIIGDRMTMLHATHMDHAAAVQASQMRWKKTNSAAVKAAMHKRGNLARKHIRWMKPYM